MTTNSKAVCQSYWTCASPKLRTKVIVLGRLVGSGNAAAYSGEYPGTRAVILPKDVCAPFSLPGVTRTSPANLTQGFVNSV